ncbi:MAG: type II toxin-antitoxin system HicB family antitoxin [Candidatus Nealsonbacteria bacterium CG_4_10_14_0_8_um_filter_35_10]|uniref:Type II toxin-antitoxin system HicB family antitoxin n=1 Tax=Candidatus Nealsonbacteria bacterium CG_4_10_14_0_8_um_filter_35_10 TaxID=1974683 RepID=A0A2M7R7E4_9BACT|nr:MAG: type II toxin-antitoxin system HicB family antitoxin [Candidatus Nealsonbacteria bacterium CG_4_10_14_0_8_um_filter_35_10]
MENYTFRIIIEPDWPVGYHGFVPLLKGVHTCGKTIEEVKKNLREAIRCHIQGLIKDKQSIPQEEEALELVQTFSRKELSLIK